MPDWINPFLYTVVLTGLTACTPALHSAFYVPDQQEASLKNNARPFEPGKLADPCAAQENYLPDSIDLRLYPTRRLRVNVHFMNSSDSAHNYPEEEAYRFVEGLLVSANKDLRENNPSWLPHRNQIPVFPVGYEMVLSAQPGDRGIYFHYDDALCYYIHKGKDNNLMDRRMAERYGIGRDSILNLFILPHFPDSLRSPTYPKGPVGVMVHDFIKMAGFFESKQPPWAYRGVLNHEVGHVFGLNHAWQADGCPDTPEHNQPCWNRTETPPCDTAASNNVMDYNALQNAWTPCQIARIRQRMANERHLSRKFLVPNGCALNEAQSIVVAGNAHWKTAADLEGSVVVKSGAELRISCRISLPANGKILVEPGGVLILDASSRLHNACGMRWQGIEMQRQGRRQGEVRVTGAPVLENLN
ncbi:MAG: hypothetical protein KBG02_13390 [Haliscomenobacter sp.]|nr:hypothetical protein [Haliscomenobacter sp.]